MEIILGLIFLPVGVYLTYLGIKMFIDSDGWFYLVKAILVSLIGLVILLSASVPFIELFD
jgi:hypothetical protein